MLCQSMLTSCLRFIFTLPHLLVTVLLGRWLSFALVLLNPLLLFLFGLRRQNKLLRYLLLRDELRDGTRFPDPAGRLVKKT